MLLRIKNLLVNNAIYFAVIITIAIAILSLVRLDLGNIPISSSDKIGHTVAYFSLVLSWLYTFSKKKQFNRFAVYSVLGCITYGIIIEVLQDEMTSYRTASGLDIVANSVGVLIGTTLFYLVEKKNRVI